MRHRLKRLIGWKRLVLIVLAVGLAGVFLPQDANSSLMVSDLATAVLTFASISFGACLTGAVLALTIPSDKQRRELAQHYASTTAKFSDFSDLVFAFTWSAMSQLPLVLLALASFVVGGKVHAAPRLSNKIPERVLLALIAAAGVNAFGQLTTVVKTISQLAHVGPLLERVHEDQTTD